MSSSLVDVRTKLSDIISLIKESHFLSLVSYVYTEDLRDEARLTIDYKTDEFKKTIDEVESSIELKAIDATDDLTAVLKLIDKYKSNILIKACDKILIYKGGIDVLCLNNTDKLKSGENKSKMQVENKGIQEEKKKGKKEGRSVYFEINKIKMTALELMHDSRFQIYDKTIWLILTILISILSLLFGYLFKKD